MDENVATAQARLRLLVIQIAVLLAFGVLSLRLWDLQIINAAVYQEHAVRNRYRLVSIEALRGVFYDRNGRLLARNVGSFTVSIIPARLPKDEYARTQVLARLSEVLRIPVRRTLATDISPKVAGLSGLSFDPAQPGILDILDQQPSSSYTPVVIASNVEREAALILEEQRIDLPGVVVTVEPRREYTTGALMAHILGFTGSIPAENAEYYLRNSDAGYEWTDQVGLTGLELTYERQLRGIKGQKHIEVDAFEREVNVLAIDSPTPGHNLVLTIDLDLQKYVEQTLRDAMHQVNSKSGVVVVMNPQTGEILAMVSVPGYDNNLFAQGISVEDYERLSTDPEHPLINHAISSLYPPGSTFKIVPACAALQEGLINATTKFECKGMLYLPNKYFPDDPEKATPFKCWNEWGHGWLNIYGAIAQSCDIFFYQATGGYGDFAGLGINKLGYYAKQFGYGEKTGIPLPGENAGLVPDDKWKRINYGEGWVTGDTYNAAIGQGYILATPLQVLNMTAAVANGGTLFQPQLVYQIVDEAGNVVTPFRPKVIRQLPLSPQTLDIVRKGMRLAVTSGTAHRINLSEVSVAGKTGSAEYPGPRDEKGNLPTHAWFTGFAPYENPEVAIVVFVAGGGSGATVAVPIAAQILRYYFGLPQPSPTPESGG